MKYFIFTLILIAFSYNLFAQNKEIDDLVNDNVQIKRQKIKGIEVTQTLTTINDSVRATTILRGKESYEFDNNGNKIVYLDYCGDSWACDSMNLRRRVFFKYNSRSELVELVEIDPYSDSVSFRREWKYLHKGRKIIEERSRHTFVSNWFSIFYFYDRKGRVIKERFQLSDSTFQETIYHYSKKCLDSISFIDEDKTEVHIFKYDKEGNGIQKSYRFKDRLACGNVADKEQYSYYPNGKMKDRLIYDRFITYKDTYEYKDSIVEVKRYSKPKLIGVEDDFQISRVTYMHYNTYGLLQLIRDVDVRNKRDEITKIDYSYWK